MGRKKTFLLHSFIAWDRVTLEGTGPFFSGRSMFNPVPLIQILVPGGSSLSVTVATAPEKNDIMD